MENIKDFMISKTYDEIQEIRTIIRNHKKLLKQSEVLLMNIKSTSLTVIEDMLKNEAPETLEDFNRMRDEAFEKQKAAIDEMVKSGKLSEGTWNPETKEFTAGASIE